MATIETLISNATTQALTTINFTYDLAANTLTEYDTKQMGALYFNGWKPVTAFAATTGAVNQNTVVAVGTGESNLKTAANTIDWLPDTEPIGPLADQLGGLNAAAQAAIKVVMDDLEGKMNDFLSTVIGVPGEFPSITTLTALDYTPSTISLADDIAAESHEALRKQREYLSSVASRGHTFMPGYAVDAVTEIHLARADRSREAAVAVTKAQNDAVLSVYNAKIAALGNALNSLTRARVALIGAAADYARSMKDGIKYAIDSEFFDALTQLKYDALRIKVIREDATVKQRAVSAYNELIQAQSAYDSGLRDYLLAKQKYTLDMRDLDYRQYSTEQKVTVRTGMQMLETLGRIAAAAESAMNVIVSSAETSFA